MEEQWEEGGSNLARANPRSTLSVQPPPHILQETSKTVQFGFETTVSHFSSLELKGYQIGTPIRWRPQAFFGKVIRLSLYIAITAIEYFSIISKHIWQKCFSYRSSKNIFEQNNLGLIQYTALVCPYHFCEKWFTIWHRNCIKSNEFFGKAWIFGISVSAFQGIGKSRNLCYLWASLESRRCSPITLSKLQLGRSALGSKLLLTYPPLFGAKPFAPPFRRLYFQDF